LSDVDVAVWLNPDLPRERLAALRAELSLAAVEALGTDEIDIVVLNEAPPLLRHSGQDPGPPPDDGQLRLA
jgi:predicted nucleotidyltransferase